MQLALQQLIIPPGHQLLIKDVSWQTYKRKEYLSYGIEMVKN
ncbi:hypothetical protein [Fischerella thermalis]|uniref:Uncharacterized protein n=1 Tax=Fischerella thermalis JSC-11 TaxID=741277 RepID=G6G068_9CYAN|nr:hypothetical protein [Fischerella thermalis]EHC08407.1 hypothetical protein FJSC11DRAFT_4517 [Fischerella thermalis JSC-11]